MKLKRLIAVVVCMTMIFSFTACGGNQEDNTSSITVTDQIGRTVEFEEPAEDIASCYYISTYACLALGLEDNLVAIEKKADERPIYHMAAEEIINLPQVGTMKGIDIEAIAATEPDVVILPAKLQDNVKALEDLGLKVIVVSPESHDELSEMIELIGQVTNHSEDATKLMEYYNEKLEFVATLGSVDKKVYMGSNSSYMETSPAEMYQSSLITAAGGENVAGNIEGDYWSKVSYETIISMNPDIIVIPAGAEYTKDDIYNDSQLVGVNAVKNRQVYQMPTEIEEWDSPIPSGILGTLWMASVLHPEQYSYEDFKSDVKDFYSEFYGFEIDEKLITM